MSHPVYQVPAGDVLPIFFSTYAGATGASVTMTGLAVTDIEIYKDASVTQRASDAGYTLIDTDGIDVDGITGIHGFSIDTGDNTDAGFYTVGAWFTVVVSAVTIDGQTVNFIAAQFRLMPAENVAGVPKVDTTHVSGNVQTASNIGELANRIATMITAAAGSPGEFAFTNDALRNVPTPELVIAALAAISAKTNLLPAAAAGTANGLLINGVNDGAITFPDGVTISSAVGDALVLSSTGGNGNGLNASGNGSGDGIHSVAGATGRGIHAQGGATSGAGFNATGVAGNANGITANGFGSGHGIAATGGATGDGVHGLGGATSGAGVVAEARAGNSNGFSCIGFGTGVDLAADNIAAIKEITDRVATMLTAAAGSPGEFRFTADALRSVIEVVLAVSPPTAAAIADAVWDEALAGHAVAGSAGASLSAAGSAGDPWSTLLPGAYAAGTAGYIVAVVNEISLRLATLLTAAAGSPGEFALSTDALRNIPFNVIADAVLDEVVEGSTTLRQSIRLANSALGGKASGLAGTAVAYRDLADTRDRITATVDADGNRTVVTRDLT